MRYYAKALEKPVSFKDRSLSNYKKTRNAASKEAVVTNVI